jgi:hypothetical protein
VVVVGDARGPGLAAEVLREVAQRFDAPARPPLRLEHQHVVPRLGELVGGAQTREAGPDHDDPPCRPPALQGLSLARGGKRVHERQGGGGQRARLQEVSSFHESVILAGHRIRRGRARGMLRPHRADRIRRAFNGEKEKA